MRLQLWLCLALLSVTLTSRGWSQEQGTRLALIIANAHYPGQQALPANTIPDAAALRRALVSSGFKADSKKNLGKVDMDKAIEAFVSKIGPNETVLFFFSGYAAQIDRRTYLFPVFEAMPGELLAVVRPGGRGAASFCPSGSPRPW
jgi:hypothetical protein